MSYTVTGYGSLFIREEDLESIARHLAEEELCDYFEGQPEDKAKRDVIAFMDDLGFETTGETFPEGIEFWRRLGEGIGELEERLPLLANWLEGQCISFMGEDGEVWFNEFHDGKTLSEGWSDLNDLMIEHMKLKHAYALARD